jgi:hypothetical protein
MLPASNTARFLFFSAVILLAPTIVIIATKGQLGRVKAATATEFGPPRLTQPRTALPIRGHRVDRLLADFRRVVSRTVTCSGRGCREASGEWELCR